MLAAMAVAFVCCRPFAARRCNQRNAVLVYHSMYAWQCFTGLDLTGIQVFLLGLLVLIQNKIKYVPLFN
jgi:hypothetical protein